MSTGLCRKCGLRLDSYYVLQGKEYHDPCAPDAMFVDPVIEASKYTNGDPYAALLREDITEIIIWANRRSERSQQVELGASEVGVTCLRRLGYRIAEIPAANAERDPWPAIVGTAVHTWLEDAVKRFEQVHGLGRWETEMTVHPSDVLKGHTDAYDGKHYAVIDYKNPGTTAMTEIRKGYVSQQYIEQVQLYALGHVRAGRRVDRVALVFFPRAGYLGGTYVWAAPYDQSIAEAALDRANRVVAGIVYYKVTEKPENWQKIPATASTDCSHCDWYNPNAVSANASGCPGK